MLFLRIGFFYFVYWLVDKVNEKEIKLILGFFCCLLEVKSIRFYCELGDVNIFFVVDSFEIWRLVVVFYFFG